MLRRAIDVVLASAALVLLAPLLVCVAIAVRLSSPGPALHRAVRTGRNGREFTLLKFRSMKIGVPGDALTRQGDARITAVGRILRKWKLDELPQLINVLRGEMSLVGPRPEDPRYVAMYTADEREVLSARPGLTGPASIAYRNEESLLAGADWEREYVQRIMRDKLRIDLEYLRRRTLLSDFGMLAKTVAAVLKR
jgi:lipopolysaccharide/colanic/teichoic acid biosynthesis glycosyltransferase